MKLKYRLQNNRSFYVEDEGNAIPVQDWAGPKCSRSLNFPEFLDSRQTKVAKLSTLATRRLYTPKDNPGIHFCYKLSRTQRHSATGRIKSMENRNDPIGNRTG